MTTENRRALVGALLLTGIMWAFALVVSDLKDSLLVAGCVFVSLVVAKNL